jgi:porphobilinogen synthase
MMNQRRLRANAHIRDLAATVSVSHRELIQPIFVEEGLSDRVPSSALSGVFTDTEETVMTQIRADIAAGVTKFLLFPIPAHKFSDDFEFDFARRVVTRIKSEFEDSIWLACDLCLCSYTTHGHCGILNAAKTQVENTATVSVLTQYALELATAGADCIAPSDMMDGRIGAIRRKLDAHGLDHVAIMSYSAKFSSNFYGPFRDVCKSAPDPTLRIQDRKTYQIDPRNLSDALASSARDADEGADFLMIKPALPNMDVLTRMAQTHTHPIVAYHVSGEYAAIDLLAREGLIRKAEAHIEIWTALKRAGTSAIITYAARDARGWLG